MSLIEFWIDLPWWLKYGVALIFLIISTVMYFNDVFWPAGWAIGGVLLLAAMAID
ncbi:MAG: hypothetical protein AAF432_14540 [Planctomycetota bacterium]